MTVLETLWRSVGTRTIIVSLLLSAAAGAPSAAVLAIAGRDLVDTLVFESSLDYRHVDVRGGASESGVEVLIWSDLRVGRAASQPTGGARTTDLVGSVSVTTWTTSETTPGAVSKLFARQTGGAQLLESEVFLDAATAFELQSTVGDNVVLVAYSPVGDLLECPVKVAGVSSPYIAPGGQFTTGLVVTHLGTCQEVFDVLSEPNARLGFDPVTTSQSDLSQAERIRSVLRDSRSLAPFVVGVMVVGIALYSLAAFRVRSVVIRATAYDSHTLEMLGVPPVRLRLVRFILCFVPTTLGALFAVHAARGALMHLGGFYSQPLSATASFIALAGIASFVAWRKPGRHYLNTGA